MAATDDDIAALVAGAEDLLHEAANDEVALQLIPLLMRTDEVIRRAKEIAALRAAKGRGLGKETRRLLQEIHDEWARMADILKGDTE